MDTVTKNNVEDGKCSRDEERVTECASALKNLGLGDYLHLAREKAWSWPEKHIVCDPQGKAIVCHNGWASHVCEVISEILGRKIEYKRLNADGLGISVYITDDAISIPERHSLATMNRYFDDYRPGFHESEIAITLPHALHALAVPVHFLNEPDAYELAMVVKNAFPNYDVDVTETSEGFAVVVQDANGDLHGWVEERMAAIADVVESFSLTPKRKPALEITDEETSTNTEWQLDTVNRYTQQQRIEQKLDAVLSRLDAGGGVTANCVAPTESPATDAHTRKAKRPARSAASKRSA